MAELEPQFLEVIETSAQELRTSFLGVQEGVWDPTDMLVTPGAGLAVSVAAGAGFVRGDTIPDQGLYRIRNDAAKTSSLFDTGGIASNSSGLPRLDQVIARIYDQTHDGSGSRLWRLEMLAGTPTAGATLTNRSGATALPASAMRLADVLVANGASSLTSNEIRDRRPRARGALGIWRTAGALNTTSTSFAVLFGSGRVEFSSNVRQSAELVITPRVDAVELDDVLLQLVIDGVAQPTKRVFSNHNGLNYAWKVEWPHLSQNYGDFGSHTFAVNYSSEAGANTVIGDSNYPATLVVREHVEEGPVPALFG